jgi:hypothetical protein
VQGNEGEERRASLCCVTTISLHKGSLCDRDRARRAKVVGQFSSRIRLQECSVVVFCFCAKEVLRREQESSGIYIFLSLSEHGNLEKNFFLICFGARERN